MYPIILTLVQFLSDCYRIFDSGDINLLLDFIEYYKSSDIGPLAQYVDGLAKDIVAVQNALKYRHITNGPIEGINSKIKMKHRRSSGRAGIELLNAYMVLSPNEVEA